LDIIDLDWLGKLAKKHNLILKRRQLFCNALFTKPGKIRRHIVTHSATKFMDGQGRVIAGAILGTKELIKEIRFFTRHTGPSLSPFNAWILSKSLETLAVRMERHCPKRVRTRRASSKNMMTSFW
jgi:O-succinylhomoserine sulfhydrylase